MSEQTGKSVVSRELLQQALNALEDAVGLHVRWDDAHAETIAALREALAAPQPEPFGWFYDITTSDKKRLGPIWQGGEKREHVEVVAADVEGKVFPLYAAPPAAPAVPLTDERLQRAYALGWIAAASWAKHDDLIDDIGSPAYVAEMTDALQVCGIGGSND